MQTKWLFVSNPLLELLNIQRVLFHHEAIFEMKNSLSRPTDGMVMRWNFAEASLKPSIHRALYPIRTQTNTIFFVYINILFQWI
jgi:hypothetical protein